MVWEYQQVSLDYHIISGPPHSKSFRVLAIDDENGSCTAVNQPINQPINETWSNHKARLDWWDILRMLPPADPHVLTNKAKPDPESRAQSIPLLRYTPLVNHTALVNCLASEEYLIL
jgi:hypothetical protein